MHRTASVGTARPHSGHGLVPFSPVLSLVPNVRRKLLSPSVAAADSAATAAATGAGFFCVWRVCLALSKHSLQMYRPCWSLIRGLPEQSIPQTVHSLATVGSAIGAH